ncbi:hypothetical protein ACEPAF_2299 [Sanghuangporus sanghuang]
MPRILRARARESSQARADSGGDTDPTSSPSRPRRNLKRTASQALPPTPPRTVKREKKSRVARHTLNGSSKTKSPTRGRSRGVRLERRLERIAEEEEEEQEKEEVSLGAAAVIGRRLDFGPAAKRRKLELDARLEALLGDDAENPFWDGPTKPKTTDASKIDVKKGGDNEEDAEKRGRAEKGGCTKHGGSDKSVRIRSPSPPLLSFRGRAPVSPPPSNRRKKKVRGKATIDTVIEEEAVTAEPPVTSAHGLSSELVGEPSSKPSLEVLPESSDEPSAKPTLEPSKKIEAALDKPVVDQVPESSDESSTEPIIKSSSETIEVSVEPSLRRLPEPIEDPFAEPEGDLSAVDSPLMLSTPKKGKKRMDSPIRDSPNNPFLDDSPASLSGEPVEPRSPTIPAEKPTIAYVFRGVRAKFANPMYNLPSEVHERSLLPVEHPDYSPDPLCPPKVLFPKSRRRQASPSPTRHKGKNSEVDTRSTNATTSTAPSAGLAAGNGWDDSDDEAELHVTPPKRLFQ